MSPAIRVEGLGKRYRIGALQTTHRTLRETLTDAAAAPFRRLAALARGRGIERSEEILWALRHVSFEVQPGEVVGVIGRNGAGKTTLLKLLSRITEPTEGEARIRGRVGSLLEVGTGFHPELTGRENIYLNSAILGLRKHEIDQRFDAIVEFAELASFIDTPVKRYSSGMYVRLAFSVAAHLEPEILLVDEVLAVGDFAFQTKCLGKISSLGGAGRTILLVSHNLSAVRRLASRTLWIDGGELRLDGDTHEVVAAYLDSGTEQLDAGGVFDLRHHRNRSRDSVPCLREIRIASDQGEQGMVPMGDSMQVEVCFESERLLRLPCPTLAIDDEEGNRIYTASPRLAGEEVPETARTGRFTCRLEDLPVNHGTYFVTVQLQEGSKRVDRIDRACSFQVTPRRVHGGSTVLSARKGFLSWPSAWTFEVGRGLSEASLETEKGDAG
ncbi:MAG: ABC transporter ATP-binding protein [Holophagales bacterium]|nr:ABC transporter ATP-binding protein [Holophagales bacterium]